VLVVRALPGWTLRAWAPPGWALPGWMLPGWALPSWASSVRVPLLRALPGAGRDEHAVETALRLARGFNAPVIVHVVTRKGMGYPPAENDEDDQMHSCGVIDPETGLATSVPGPGWTSTFSEALIAYGTMRRDIVAITAAMPGPTGLSAFRRRFPDRFFDVGIAEQHAMTSAAGLAMGPPAGAGVVTVTVFEAGEGVPVLSRATTEKEYCCCGVRNPTCTLVIDGSTVRMRVPPWYTS